MLPPLLHLLCLLSFVPCPLGVFTLPNSVRNPVRCTAAYPGHKRKPITSWVHVQIWKLYKYIRGLSVLTVYIRCMVYPKHEKWGLCDHAWEYPGSFGYGHSCSYGCLLLCITVYIRLITFSNMFRLVNLRFSRFPNTLFRKGELVAIQDIRKGECIRPPAPPKILRTKEERKEIERLADETYTFATKN